MLTVSTAATAATDCSCETAIIYCNAALVREKCSVGAGACVFRPTVPRASRDCRVYLTETNCMALGLSEGVRNVDALRSAVQSPDLGLHCRETFFNPLRLVPEDLGKGASCCTVAHELSHVFSRSCSSSGVAEACEETTAEDVESRCLKDITEDWCNRAIASGSRYNIETCALWCLTTVQASSVLENDRCVCRLGSQNPPLNRSHCSSCETQCNEFGRDHMPRVCLSPTIMNFSMTIPQTGGQEPQSATMSEQYAALNEYLCSALARGEFSHSCPSYLPPPEVILEGSDNQPAPPPACDSLSGATCPSAYPRPAIGPVQSVNSCTPRIKWKPSSTSGVSAPFYKTWFAEIQQTSSGTINPVPGTVKEAIVSFPGPDRSRNHYDIGPEPGKQFRKLKPNTRYRFAMAACRDKTCTPSGMSAWSQVDFGTSSDLATRCTPPTSTKTLTVTKVGRGTVKSSTPTGTINCGDVCIAQVLSTAEVTLSASAASGSSFSHWSGACAGTGPCRVRMDEARNVTANFRETPNSAVLSVAVDGNGSVQTPGGEISCQRSCSATFTRNQSVILTAQPSAGYKFSAWMGACAGQGRTCSVLMTGDRSATARFTAQPNPTLTIQKAGTGSGTVTSSPAAITCGTTCASEYPQQTSITLTAAPSASSVFSGWGDGVCSGQGPTCSFVLSRNEIVTANFSGPSTNTSTLSVSKNGTGSGMVTSVPSGINCGLTCSRSFSNDARVTLTANASGGSTFIGWTEACTGQGPTCEVSMTSNKSVTAEFATTGAHIVSVSKEGAGQGTVASTTGGINCGADCSEPFLQNESVRLSALPLPGSSFQGWTGPCTTSELDCTFVVNGPTSVTARFEPLVVPR